MGIRVGWGVDMTSLLVGMLLVCGSILISIIALAGILHSFISVKQDCLNVRKLS